MLTINQEDPALGKALRRVLELLSENEELKIRCNQLEDKYLKLKAEHEAHKEEGDDLFRDSYQVI